MNGENGTALALRREGGEIQRSAHDVVSMTHLVQEVMRSVMKDGQHFGKVPGCGDKPALLKPGAEKLCVTFRLAAMPEVECVELGNGHREYRVSCKVVHIPTGEVWGGGVGCCSTMESKYRYRQGGRKCPECGKAAIIKGKAEYGGGWVCFKKKDGCGAKFADKTPEAAEFEKAEAKVENPDIADTYNTVLKMAKKRALVDATLTATAASDIFTQDIEELAETMERTEPPPPQRETPRPPAEPEGGELPVKQRLFDLIEKASGVNKADRAAAIRDTCAAYGVTGLSAKRPLADDEAASILDRLTNDLASREWGEIIAADKETK